MSDFLRMADEAGNDLIRAGIGLEVIANLLGADGSEHHLSDSDINGLEHAALALSRLIKNIGYELCEAVEIATEDAQESREVSHG